MKWLKKFEYKTWLGELCGNTFSLVISLAFISFLTIATEGSLIAIAATSFWWSWRARWNPFRSGFLPSFIASSILLGGYVISGKEMMTPAVMAALFFGNLLMISVIAAIFSGLGAWIRNRKIKKDTDEKNRLEKSRAQFSENLRRIAIIVLFFYVQMFVAVPFAAKVSAASTSQTSDEFIKNYDPDTKYTIKTKAVNEPIKRRVPLESPYSNVTGSELEQLEAYCKANGCNLGTVGGELSKLRLNGQVSMEAYFATLDKTYAPKPPVVSWTDSLILPQVAKAISDKLSGKKAPVKAKSKAKPDTRPWYQKAWSGVKGAYDAYQTFDHAFSKAVQKPFVDMWNFAKKKPWQAIGIGALAVGITVSAVVWAPVAAVVGVVAVVTGGIAALGLAKAYHDDGWNGVKNNVFSKSTQAMWNSGDKAGAAGQGLAEGLGKALEILPLAEAPKAAAAVVKIIPEIRVTIALVSDGSSIAEGGIKVLKAAAKLASGNTEDLAAMGKFIKNLGREPENLALVKSTGNEVTETGKIAGARETYVAEKKGEGIVKKVVEEEKANFTQLSQEKIKELNIPNKDLHAVQFTNKSYGVKADTSNFAEGSLQHIFEGEINQKGKMVGLHMQPESVAPPSRIIPDNPNIGANEVYTGKVELYGVSKSTNKGKSTFFPKSWSKEQTIQEIDSAFQNKKLVNDNGLYEGTSKSGVKIEMYLDPKTGKITAPRPRWPQN